MNTIEDVQFSFKKLVDSYRTRALWFTNNAQPVDITAPGSVGVLNSIAQKCSRADWVEIKKIKQWLSQNIKQQ